MTPTKNLLYCNQDENKPLAQKGKKMLYTWIVDTTDGVMIIHDENQSSAMESALLQFEYPENVRIRSCLRVDVLVNGFMVGDYSTANLPTVKTR